MDIAPDYNSAPRNSLFHLPKFHDAIERCFECATSCWISADAFIGERDADRLQAAIDRCLDSAEICARTVRMLVAYSRHTREELLLQLDECVRACQAAAREASDHCGNHEHCWICVKSCEECLRACEGAKMDLEVESSTDSNMQV